MKKILAFLLSITVIFCTLPFGVFTVNAIDNGYYTKGFYTYFVATDRVTITDCDTTIKGAVTIPKTFEGLPVTQIGSYAYS